MAILKFKKLIEDLQNNTSQVLPSISKTVPLATSAGYAGTARVAQYGSSGTGKLAGTHAAYGSGAQGF